MDGGAAAGASNMAAPASPNLPPTAGAEDMEPIFDVQKVDMQFAVAADFAAAQIANNVLVLGLHTGRIMRIDLDVANEVDDIDLPKKPSEVGVIRRLFVDPTASHLIISTTLGENFYLHAQSRAPKQLSRLKGVFIESVSWNPSQPTASTREILIGSTEGAIYETYIESTTEFYRREEKYLKMVYRIEGPVSGIWTDILSGVQDLRRVMIATPRTLLHFVGRLGRHGHEGSGSVFAKLFENESPTPREISTRPAVGVFAVTPEVGDMPVADSSRPERIFAWLTTEGVLHGRLLYTPANPSLGAQIFADARTLSPSQLTDTKLSEKKPAPELPSLMALTQWHILLLIENRVVAVNRLDNSIVHDQVVLDADEKPIGLFADLKKNTFWLFTSRSIFEIEVKNEDRDVWKVLLKSQKFDAALQYANNSTQRDIVAIATGDHLMKKDRFLEAAEIYGKSSKPFEQVALAFMDKGEKDALRKYLLMKLSTLKKSAVMQRIMLTSWLTEVFMSKLNALDDMMMTNAELTEDTTPKDVESQRNAVKHEFQDFIRKYRSDLDKKTVYDIISSHGREEELLYFSTALNDNNFVLAYWVQRENWSEALKAMNRQPDPEIIYKYSSVLMAHAPMEFVDIVTRQSNLDPRRLIPALLNYNQVSNVPLDRNQAVRYLLFEINHNNSEDSAVHNTLVSIYAAADTKSENALLAYLESQTPTTVTSNLDETLRHLPYDADFALRLCIRHGRVRACVVIYSTMRQFGPAVELALEYNEIDLAISIAERPEHDIAQQKKLWIAIARSVISQPAQLSLDKDGSAPTSPELRGLAHKKQTQEQASIKTALSLIHRAPPGILRVEDLLPLFPDFVLIDDFKEEICAALESYSSTIDTLKHEMDASAATSSRLQADVKKLGNRWVLLEPGESCAVCGEVLLERRFWVWACGHGVHGDCAIRECEARGGKVAGRRAKELRELLEQGVEGRRREEAQRELDEIVGAQCPRCGDMAVRAVDEPFGLDGQDSGDWAL